MPEPRLIPTEEFFRKPRRAGVRISPDGRYLGWLAPWKRRLNVHLRDLETGEERRVTHSTARDVRDWAWAGDRQLVYSQDSGGDENYRLFAVAADGSASVDLTPFEGVQCHILDLLEDQPGQLLFRMNRRDPRIFDVYRADIVGGGITLVAENPGNIRSWVTDCRGRVRAALAGDGTHTSLLWRADDKDEWTPLETHGFRESVVPLRFTFDDRGLLVASNLGRDRRGLHEYDPTAGGSKRLIFEHPEVDIGGIAVSRRRGLVTAVAFEAEKPGWHFFDSERRAQQEFLDERLPGRRNRLSSHTRDETRWIVCSSSDRVPGSYHLLTWEEGGRRRELLPLFDACPWLVEQELARTRPIRLTSRDGLTLHGYLTLPNGREPKHLPLVLNPHGGPWYRDTWDYNPEVQFLANRGAAVLQIDYRGSTGYGKAFWEASFGQWGLAMQDDLTDALRWTVDAGIADPDRVAIYGGSYGGYATLAGITRDPELFACAVSYCGVSNLFTWLDAFPPYWQAMRDRIHRMVGHPVHDAERLERTSPLFHVGRIRCPLLVAQGANDPRVPRSESDQLVEALRERGVAVEYLLKEDEGHGFEKEENQLEFYAAMQRFLALHLGLEEG